MAEIKCPCGLRNHMEEEDCRKTNCNACFPLTKPQTNADRIRVMRDRELADFLSGKFSEVCCSEHSLSVIQLEALKHNLFCIFMKWLKQPAE